MRVEYRSIRSRHRIVDHIRHGHIVAVWRTVECAGFTNRWVVTVDDPNGYGVGRTSHHATRERACRAAAKILSRLSVEVSRA
jgi:hypothetical protein